MNDRGVELNTSSSVSFTQIWEDLCKNEISISYGQGCNVSVYKPLTRNSHGEIVGHSLRGLESCPNSIDFWVRCFCES